MESLRRQGILTASHPWLTKYAEHQLFDSGPQTDERVVFDDKCNAYTVVSANYSSVGQSFLLHSKDGGHSWRAYAIPKTDDPLYTPLLEAPVNGAVLHTPPALIVAEKYDPIDANGVYPPNSHHAWLVYGVLTEHGDFSLAGPFEISAHTLCCGNHSGFEAQAVSYRDHIHIAYPGDNLVVDSISGRLGTPQYIRTFSRQRRQFINSPVFIGTGLLGPQNQRATAANNIADSHSQTAVAIDDEGYIHVVIAGHGSRMLYRKATHPDDGDYWDEPEVFTLQSKPGSQKDFIDEYTYASLVLDRLGQPNVLARWSGEGYTFRLIYVMRSNLTHSWTDQRVLLDPGRAYYGVWYHKMSMDPWGRIFISYSYHPDNLFSNEATLLSNLYAFTLKAQPSNPPCVPTNSTDPNPKYCDFLGYEDIGGAILMQRSENERFRLATTRDFLDF